MSNNRYNIPVSEDVREWLEDSMGWLHSNFKEEFFSKPVLTPNSPLFSFRFTGDFSDADKVLQILLEVMDISAEDVELNFYADGQKQVGGNGGMFMLPGTGQKFTGGLYHGKGRDGKYHISLNVDSVKIPNRLIAVLAHELAHVKLLGERRLKINNEHLTDLLTIVFGFGIFNSTEAFTYSRNAESWSYSRAGYLSQMEWGYALALHAWLRKEENPDWLQFIPIDVENDFKKSMRFILDNESLIMATEFIGDEIPAHPEAEKTEPIDYDKEKEILQNAESMYKLATEDPAAAAKAIYEQFKNGETDAYILELGLYCNMDTQQFLKADEIATYIENSNNLDERQLCNIAILKTALKEYEKALTYYEKALEQNPFNTTALNNMGFQLNQLGRYDEAISYFDELIEYEPDFLFAWSNRALAKIKSGKTTDGMHDIKVALSIDDSHAYTYRVLGIYHLDRNENDEALKHFKKAQVLDAAVDDIDMLIRMAQLKNML